MLLPCRNIFKMRKYHQLFLLIITIVSLLSLLIYRHEYLKLRYVLEVFNYFGGPQVGDDCLVLNDTYMDNFRNRNMFSQPKPSWIKVGKHYVYSSFWESESNKLHVRALAVGPPSAFTNYECHIWFDQGDFLNSIMGRFGYSLKSVTKYYNESKEHESVNIYELFCEPVETTTQGLPYGLVLVHGADKLQIKTFIPVFISESPTLSKNKDKIVTCVRADTSGALKSSIVEFINYHQSVGVTDFVIYENGIQYKILSVLESLSGQKGFSESISTLHWNFPYNDLDVESTVLELDCIARTSGKAESLIILNWDEYLVPKSENTIKEMFEKTSYTKKIPVQYVLESFICCTDLKDDKGADKSWPLALRKTQLMKVNVKHQIMIQYPQVGIEPKRHDLPSSTGAIHIYKACSGMKTITKYDRIMAKHLGGIITSKLYKLWKSGSLLTESVKVL